MQSGRRVIALFALAAVASVLFAVVAGFVAYGWFDQLDVAVELAVHRLDSAPADVVFRGATLIGSDVVIWPVIGALVVVCWRHGKRSIAWILIGESVAEIVMNNVLKALFTRPRPTLFDKVGLPASWSFPSGHAMSSMAIWGGIAAALIALFPSRKRLVVPLAVVLIGLIGASRVYLGVHWPSDVVGGWLAGTPFLVAAVYLLHHRNVR